MQARLDFVRYTRQRAVLTNPVLTKTITVNGTTYVAGTVLDNSLCTAFLTLSDITNPATPVTLFPSVTMAWSSSDHAWEYDLDASYFVPNRALYLALDLYLGANLSGPVGQIQLVHRDARLNDGG